MRDLVYLSERKLSQFLPDPVPRWRRLGRLKAAVTAPVGSVSIEPVASDDSGARASHLKNVVAHVEQNSHWFASAEFRAGAWIYFEEWLNYRVFRPDDQPPVVLFLNVNRDAIGETRLLLHGSAEHLQQPGKSGSHLRKEWYSASDGYLFIDMVWVLREMIEDLDAGVALHPPDPHRWGHRACVGPPWTLEGQIKEVVWAFDKINSPQSAADGWVRPRYCEDRPE